MDLLFTSSDDPRQAYFHLPETARPPGMDTQWLRFRFRSEGLLSNSPGTHLAVALRARLGFSEAGVADTISGRGIALGDTSAAAPPPGHPLSDRPEFGGARGATVESFWPRGNFLYRAAGVLPDGLQDHRWYQVGVEVDEDRWIAFRIADDAGQVLHPEPLSRVQDAAAHPVIPGATGVVIALGRDLREHGPWRAEIRDLRHGWRTGSASA